MHRQDQRTDRSRKPYMKCRKVEDDTKASSTTTESSIRSLKSRRQLMKVEKSIYNSLDSPDDDDYSNDSIKCESEESFEENQRLRSLSFSSVSSSGCSSSMMMDDRNSDFLPTDSCRSVHIIIIF